MAYTEDFHGTSGDLPNVRTYEVDNNVLRAIRTDPYGFVHISYERGVIPEELKGNYTSFYEADQVIQSYLERRKSKLPNKTADKS